MIKNIEFVVLLAGKSTRNYPQSKGLAHKALLPFGDKKVIDYIVDNLISAGAKYITFVVSDMDTIHTFEECFFRDLSVEKKFKKSGKTEQLKLLQSCYLPSTININYVIQHKPLGTGHALGLAAKMAEGRSIAMVFPDDVVLSKKGDTVYQRAVKDYKGGNRIITRPVEDPSRWGIVENGKYIEKPKKSTSNESGVAMMIFDPVVAEKLIIGAEKVEKGEKVKGMLKDEFLFVQPLNEAVIEDPKNQSITTIPLKPTDVYFDCGQLKEYEQASMYMYLTQSVFKKEHKAILKKWLDE